MATINDLPFNDTPNLSDSVPIYKTSSGVTQRTSVNQLLQGGISSLPTVQPVDGSNELWIDPLNGNAVKAAIGPSSNAGSGNLPDAGTLTGAENVPISRGAGLLQTTLTKIAQWVIQTYQGFTQSGTGAVARTVQDKQRERISLLDFGADPTGATDSYTAIMAFWSVLKVSGKKGVIPQGTYKSNTAIVWDMAGLGAKGVVVEGDGQYSTVFDLSGVATSPAFMITKSDGAAFYSSFRDFGIRANIAGAALQLGRTDFTDPLNSFQFQNMWIGNNSPSTPAIGVQVNYVLGSTFTNIVPACNHGGDSWQWNACAFCTWIGGSGTWAQNGIHMTAGGAGNGAIAGNTVIGMDFEENVNAAVKIDTANARNNTFIGGTFVYNPNAYTAWAPSTVYALNATVSNIGAVYQATTGGTSASSGGPSGQGSAITDGTVVWNYLYGASSNAIDATAGNENFFFNPNTLCYPSGTASYANFFKNSNGCGLFGKFGMSVGLEEGNPSFSATLSTNQSLTAGSWTKLQFNTVTFQGGTSSYDGTTNYRFTAPFAGRFRFRACVNTNATNAAAATAYVALYKNGSNFRAAGAGVPGGANFIAPQIDAMLYLNAGDYVECWANLPASSGSPQASGGTAASFFEGNYLG